MAAERAPSLTGGDVLSLRLYVAGGAPNSSQARSNLNAILGRCPGVRYDLEVVDSLDDPQRALRDGVLVTPTLLKLSPPPASRIIGTLSATPKVLAALGISDAEYDRRAER